MGHEYAGIVEEVGAEVTTIKPGQFVVGSFFAFDNTCEICRAGYQTSCIHREPSAPAQRMRVPLADGTLVGTPEVPTTTWCRTFWPPPTCWEPGGSAPWPPRPDQEGPCGERRPVPTRRQIPRSLLPGPPGCTGDDHCGGVGRSSGLHHSGRPDQCGPEPSKLDGRTRAVIDNH
jgi:hypothetical protein